MKVSFPRASSRWLVGGATLALCCGVFLRNCLSYARALPVQPPAATSRELTSSRIDPFCIAVSGDSVFLGTKDWSAMELSSGVFRIPKSGGAPALVVPFKQACPLASDGGAVAFYGVDREHAFVGARTGGIYLQPVSGGAPSLLARDQEEVRGLVLDGGFVYWTAAGHEGKTGSVMRAPVTSGPVQVLAEGAVNLQGLAVDDRYVYWLDRGPSRPWGFGGRPSHDDGRVLRCPKQGGATEVLIRGIEGPLLGLALGQEELFFSTGSQKAADMGHAFRMKKAGGHAERITPDVEMSEPLALVGGRVIWSSGGVDETAPDMGVWSVTPDGKAVTRLTADLARFNMAPSGEQLFFIDNHMQVRVLDLAGR